MTDFCECLHPDEVASATQCLGRILDGGPRDVREIRLKRKYIPPVAEPGAEEHSAWILAVSFPLVVDGKVKLLMGYVSDISRQKWAESVQSRNSAAALEAKRRQEDFIDTTSHEVGSRKIQATTIRLVQYADRSSLLSDEESFDCDDAACRWHLGKLRRQRTHVQ